MKLTIIFLSENTFAATLKKISTFSFTKGSSTIGEFGYGWVNVAVTPNAGLDAYEISIAKTASGGEVATKGFNAKQVIYY